MLNENQPIYKLKKMSDDKTEFSGEPAPDNSEENTVLSITELESLAKEDDEKPKPAKKPVKKKPEPKPKEEEQMEEPEIKIERIDQPQQGVQEFEVMDYEELFKHRNRDGDEIKPQ